MSLSRVVCEMTENQDYDSDPQSKIVLQVVLTSENRINTEIQSFGYNTCWTGHGTTYKKYPFILQVDTDALAPFRLDYGGHDEKSEDRLNLQSKTIKAGEMFTYYECRDGERSEYIYQITGVTPIDTGEKSGRG